MFCNYTALEWERSPNDTPSSTCVHAIANWNLSHDEIVFYRLFPIVDLVLPLSPPFRSCEKGRREVRRWIKHYNSRASFHT